MRFAFVMPPVLALAAGAALADPGKPVTEKDVSARDVAATPVADLNLRKDEIPALLIAAQERPYALRGLGGCQQLAAAIGELDALLGDDVDLPQSEASRTSAGRVAQSVVGSFIPFRGVIREISGASDRERQLQSAIYAGVARRAFLKGTGEARGCRYPARSATLEVFNQKMSALSGKSADAAPPASPAPAAAPKPPQRREPAGKIVFTSRPVVQRTQ